MNHLYDEADGRSVGDQNATLDRIFELTALLGDHMAQSLAQRGLTRARATVVWRLFHDGPMTQRQLAKALEVTPRNVTGLLDALEGGGFVVRNPHPTDRRATLVAITTKGRATARAMNKDHETFAANLFAGLPDHDLRRFDDTLSRVLAHLQAVAGADATGRPTSRQRLTSRNGEN